MEVDVFSAIGVVTVVSEYIFNASFDPAPGRLHPRVAMV